MGGRGSGSGDSLGTIRNSAMYKQEYNNFIQQDLEGSRLSIYFNEDISNKMTDSQLATQMHSDREV